MAQKKHGKEKEKIYRIIDANINRLREALRVVEDIIRFVVDNKNYARKLKTIRHDLESILEKMKPAADEYEKCRDSAGDVGRSVTLSHELKRRNLHDVLSANLHRGEESLRVLEEIVKMYDGGSSIKFKALRYKVYGLEKSLLELL